MRDRRTRVQIQVCFALGERLLVAPSEVQRIAEIEVYYHVEGVQLTGALRFLNRFLQPTHCFVVVRQSQMAVSSVRVQLNGPLQFRAGGGEIKVIIEQAPAPLRVS